MENKNKVILVLEDEKPLLEAIKIKLTKNNFDVVSARSVEQAKQCVADASRIDAVWLDHYLIGKEDGLDFIAWCKGSGDAKLKDAPIFVVSDTVSGDKVTAYMSLGAEKCFVKSSHRLDEIIREISKILSSKSVKNKI